MKCQALGWSLTEKRGAITQLASEDICGSCMSLDLIIFFFSSSLKSMFPNFNSSTSRGYNAS